MINRDLNMKYNKIQFIENTLTLLAVLMGAKTESTSSNSAIM